MWVLPADLERSRVIDEEFLRGQIPDLPVEGPELAGGDDACPACGEAAPADAAECPGCGLVLIVEE